MADYFRIHTAVQTVPCSEEDFRRLATMLSETDKCPHGFEVEYNLGELYLYAENGIVGNLPRKFLEELGKLLRAASMPYLEVGVANTCSKMLNDSHSGGEWRLYPDGEVQHARLTYLERDAYPYDAVAPI